jgi:Na+/H+-dicarboxylate symporter
MNLKQTLNKVIINPITISASLLLGAIFGAYFPEHHRTYELINEVYIDLTKVIILPFLVSSVIISTYHLASSKSAEMYLRRIVTCMVLGMIFAGAVGLVYMVVVRPGGDLTQDTIQSFGRMVQIDSSVVETRINLLTPYSAPQDDNLVAKLIVRLIPSNVFNALSTGDTLKTLVFALFFGLSVALVHRGEGNSLIDSCETVFQTCQRMMMWLLYPLPLASFSLAAEEVSSRGFEPFFIMIKFILAFAVTSAILVAVCIAIIGRRSRRSFLEVLVAHKETSFIALSTCSSALCMPSMITAMVERLGFSRSITQLMVPLGTSLFRVASVQYYVMATVFIAQLYGRDLSMGDYVVVVLVSIIAGISSTGMGGILYVSQAGIVCSFLDLPFEAVLVLLVAVDPICDYMHTLTTVFGVDTLVAMVAPGGGEEDADVLLVADVPGETGVHPG